MSESMPIDYSSLSELESEARDFLMETKSEHCTYLHAIKKLCDNNTQVDPQIRLQLYELELRQILKCKKIGYRPNHSTRLWER